MGVLTPKDVFCAGQLFLNADQIQPRSIFQAVFPIPAASLKKTDDWIRPASDWQTSLHAVQALQFLLRLSKNEKSGVEQARRTAQTFKSERPLQKGMVKIKGSLS